jgi:hypothetical protein
MPIRFLVDVFIWHQNLLPERFSFAGHVMVAHHCMPKAWLSQYPHKPGEDSDAKGPNTYWTYEQTMVGAQSRPAAVFSVGLPDRDGFQREVQFQKDNIPLWGAFPPVNSRTYTHCARAASQALQAGGLPINSAFNKMDDGGQIFPKTLHTILSRLAGVYKRNLKGYSGEPHDWSVRLQQGCLMPAAPGASGKAKKS